MTSDFIFFAGIDLSSGRKPVTFVALDEDLNISMLETWNSSDLFFCLQEYENSLIAVNVPSSKRGRELYTELKDRFLEAGFQPFTQKLQTKQWLEMDAQDSFRTLSGHSLLPRRSLEGRLQRSAILYEQGLQITDPIDMFEEITRYKLIQGILPLQNLPSSKGLDALVAAYLAWMSVNRPGQIAQRDGLVLPAQE